MSLLGPALALWLAAPMPGAPMDELRPGQRFELSADTQTYDANTGVFVATGQAVLRTDELTLRADTLVYEQKAQRALARGNVLVVGELGAAMADQVVVDLQTQTATLDDAVFLQKSGVTPEQLATARSAEELDRLGKTDLALSARSLERLGPRELRARGLSFTPCDCDPRNPSWRIRASSADVIPGDRAILRWPVVFVHEVPVLAFPYLDLPLTSRRTGLLVPRPSGSAQNGFTFEQPVFVTLGQSYDLTLTPGYFAGSSADYGIAGPRLHTEFRYTPAEGTSGRVGLGLLYDLRDQRDPRTPARLLAAEGERRGLRGDLRVDHVGKTGVLGHRADVSLASDAYLPRDLVSDVVARETTYLRSTLSLERRFADAYVGVSSILRQDLGWGAGWGYRLLGADHSPLTGERLPGPRTLQQLPELLVSVPERRVGGTLRIGAVATFTRIAPLASTFADEGLDGVFNPFVVDEGQSDDVFQRDRPGFPFIPGLEPHPGESEARDRFSVRPQVSLPVDVGPLRAVPYGAYRSDLWYGEASGRVFHRSYAVAGLNLSSEASRIFGDGARATRHVVVPELELRTVPYVFGKGVLRDYDAGDAAVPHHGFWDAVAQLRQSLWLKRDGRVWELLRLDVGQGADLREERLADAFARVGFQLPPVTFTSTARVEPKSGRLALLSLTGNLDLPRGRGLSVGYDNVLTTGSDLQRTSLERLVGDAPPPDAVRGQRVTFGARAQLLAGFGLRYDLTLQPGTTLTPFQDQTVTALYAPACECWTLAAYARLQRQPPQDASDPPSGRLVPDFGASLSISGFGSFGTP